MGFPQANYEDIENHFQDPSFWFIYYEEVDLEDCRYGGNGPVSPTALGPAVHWSSDGEVTIDSNDIPKNITLKLVARHDGNTFTVYETTFHSSATEYVHVITWQGASTEDNSCGGMNITSDDPVCFWLEITTDDPDSFSCDIRGWDVTIGSTLITCDTLGIAGQPVKPGNEWCSPTNTPTGNFFNKDEDNAVQAIDGTHYTELGGGPGSPVEQCGGKLYFDLFQEYNIGFCSDYYRMMNSFEEVIWITSELCEDLDAPDDWCDGVIV